jgi:hypothetical protein
MFFILPGEFAKKTLQLFVLNSKRLEGYTQWVHFFFAKVHTTHSQKNTLRFLFKKHPDEPCFYLARPGGTRRLSSSTNKCSGAY